MKRVMPVTVAVAVLAMSLGACAGQAHSSRGQIQISAPAALADQPIDVSVTGLAPGQQVTISARSDDAAHIVWRSQATFTAGSDGTVNLSSAKAADGSYTGTDGMGLFWSMTTDPTVTVANTYFQPAPPQDKPAYPVLLTVTSHGRRLASRTVTRTWMAPGETAKVLTPRADGVAGVLFLPPPGTPRHPGVLIFGGAEGGMNYTDTAALLAAHGYPALTVAYFGWPGLPGSLTNIPLEYFVTAGRILARQPGVDPAHLLAMGYSRGSEAALLLAEHFPGLFHGAVVYSPSAYVNFSEADLKFNDSAPAWTLGGKGIWPAPIPMRHIIGPVLAIAGDSDQIWNSEGAATQIASQLDLAGSTYPHHALIYLNAGHGVGTFPYLPIDDGMLQALGGTRAGDVAAQRASWAAVLAELARL